MVMTGTIRIRDRRRRGVLSAIERRSIEICHAYFKSRHHGIDRGLLYHEATLSTINRYQNVMIKSRRDATGERTRGR